MNDDLFDRITTLISSFLTFSWRLKRVSYFLCIIACVIHTNLTWFSRVTIKFNFRQYKNNTKEIHEKLQLKVQWDSEQKISTFVYNYYQWWQRYKSEIINNINYIVGVTRNKQVAYFHCGPIRHYSFKGFFCRNVTTIATLSLQKNYKANILDYEGRHPIKFCNLGGVPWNQY